MGKYMLRANYTQAGLAGLMKEGGSGRRTALAQAVESVGGKLESFYYVFGDRDLLMVADFPDDAAAAAVSLKVGAAGALEVDITVLVEPETIDEAVKKSESVPYRLPGA